MTQVSMMSVRLLAAAVERSGKCANFLTEIGIDPARLGDAYARIPVEDYSRMVHHALAASGDPALGLHMAEHASLGSYDVLGYLSAESACLREALVTCQRYTRVVKDGPRLDLQEMSDTAIATFTVSSEDSVVQRLTCEFAQLGLLTLMRHYIGGDALPVRVHFGYRAPAYRVEYSRVFGGRVRFSQPFTGMEFPCTWLGRGHNGRSQGLRDWLEIRANELLTRATLSASTSDRVKGWLTAHKDLIQPTMEGVARDLGVSTRTLRRYLRSEETSFDALVEVTLAERAKQLLRNPNSSIQEVAYALGYHTPSAFSRAFKRWTGATPSEFRILSFLEA